MPSSWLMVYTSKQARGESNKYASVEARTRCGCERARCGECGEQASFCHSLQAPLLIGVRSATVAAAGTSKRWTSFSMQECLGLGPWPATSNDRQVTATGRPRKGKRSGTCSADCLRTLSEKRVLSVVGTATSSRSGSFASSSLRSSSRSHSLAFPLVLSLCRRVRDSQHACRVACLVFGGSVVGRCG